MNVSSIIYSILFIELSMKLNEYSHSLFFNILRTNVRLKFRILFKEYPLKIIYPHIYEVIYDIQ